MASFYRLGIIGALGVRLLWASIAGEIVHLPPRQVTEGQTISIEAIYTGDPAEITQARILYRKQGQVGYLETPLELRDAKLVGSIPGEIVAQPGIEYLIVLNLNNGGLVAYPPSDDPLNNPVKVPVSKPTQVSGTALANSGTGQSGQIIILSPSSGEKFQSGEPLVIAASMFNLENVDVNKVKLFLDNKDVTAYASISPDVITYTPQNLKPGTHTVYLEVGNIYGVRIATASWNFQVLSGTQSLLNVTLHSNVSLSSRVDELHIKTLDTSQASGDSVYYYNPIKKTVNRLDFNTDADFAWAKLRLLANLTSLEDTLHQPQNRYSLMLRNRWVKWILGDATPMVNRLALWGKRVRGNFVDLRLKYFNLQFVRGITDRSISGGAVFDTTAMEWQRTGYHYKRGLTAIHPSVGDGKHFELGLIFLHARDSVNTVTLKPKWFPYEYNYVWEHANYVDTVTFGQEERISFGDTSKIYYRLAGVKPQDNLVLGTDFKLFLDDRHIISQFSAAVSINNSDISDGPIARSQLDTFALLGDTLLDNRISGNGIDISLGKLDSAVSNSPFSFLLNADGQFDPAGKLADYIIVNQNLTLPIDYDKFQKGHRLAALTAMALDFDTKLNYANNFVTINYRFVGPKFISQGNPYIGMDYAGWKISDKIRLLNNMLYLDLTYENLYNNVSSIDPYHDPQTSVDTKAFGFSFNPGRGLPRINASVKGYSRNNHIDTLTVDSTGAVTSDPRENNFNLSSTVSVNYSFAMPFGQNSLTLNFLNSKRNDLRVGNEGLLRGTNMVGATVHTTWNVPLTTTITFRSNSNQLYEPGDPNYQKNQFITFGLLGVYRMLADHLLLRSGIQMLSFNKKAMQGSTIASTDQSQFHFNFGTVYRIPPLEYREYKIKSQLTANMEFRKYSSKSDGYSYTDKFLSLSYELTF